MFWLTVTLYLLLAFVVMMVMMVIDAKNDELATDLGTYMFCGIAWPFLIFFFILLGIMEVLKKVAIWIAKKMEDREWNRKNLKD